VAPLLLLRVGVDLHEAKERIATALVESILQRAGYGVRRPMADRQSSRRPALEEFTPSFYLSGAETYGPNGEFPVVVAYRPFLDAYITLENQRRQSSVNALARRQWPGLQLVVVTDHPPAGRSCFQAVVAVDRGSDLRALNLVDLPGLALVPSDVTEHEKLLVRMFALLAGQQGPFALARAV
jgi:hypothetical protein